MQMWNHLLNSGLLKDVSIFAGAYATIQAVNKMRTHDIDPAFQSFEYVQAFGYVPILSQLICFEQHILFRELLRATEEFLKTAAKGNVRIDGFRVNRMSNDILRRVRAIVLAAKRSSNDDIAFHAMDFERDELPILMGMVDDTVRNMLIGD